MALTKFNFNSFDVTTAASKGLGFNASANGFSTFDDTSMVLIKTLTASSSATLSFVDGSSDVVLDNTYPVYMFKFINIHPADHATTQYIMFQGSTDTGSNYNTTITSTYFRAEHGESDSPASMGYVSGADQAQGTSFQRISDPIGNENDECGVGELFLFNPSSTTFVKHFMATTDIYEYGNRAIIALSTGYFNTTSAIDAVQFKMNSGNMESGTIKLYGIKDS